MSTESHVFSVTLASLDYAGLGSIYFGDLEQGTGVEKTVVTPFSRGSRGIQMPETTSESLSFQHREVSIRIDSTENAVSIRVDATLEKEYLAAEFSIHYPKQHETLNVVVLWSRRRFQFTSKQNTLPARGMVRIGLREVPFDGIQSYACADFGRGVWPIRSAWNWGAASGTRDGRRIGLNLGGQWTDGTGMTENAICVDGRLSKVSEDLIWTYDRTDFMKPWHIHTRGGERINLAFTPVLERIARQRAGPLHSEVHQLFGRYTGAITTETGKRLAVEELIGWAEEHRARW